MSLTVYLEGEGEVREAPRVPVRLNGSTKLLTLEEWDALYPGRQPLFVYAPLKENGFSENITHNLGTMAEKAGLYQYLWSPDEVGITQASQLIEPLQAGLELLESDPEEFKKYNPSNGWGNYEGLVAFVKNYLEACKNFPEAKINVSK